MSKTAVIIGAGEFPKKPYPLLILERADYVVCCDSALRAYLRHAGKASARATDNEQTDGNTPQRLPDAVIGDMDSLSPALKKRYGHLLVHIPEQETNDQTKAFHYIMEHFPDVGEIFFLAATGKREDHTIGNISLLMEYCREVGARGINLRMVSDFSTIFPITHSTSLECGVGRRISLLTPDNSLRIRSKGLEWPTGEVIFDNWWKATLNRSVEDVVNLEFSHDSIAIVIID